MGTEVSVTIALPAHGENRGDALRAIVDVEQRMESFGYDWWPWSGGALTRINEQLARGVSAEIPANMRSLFARAWALRQASGGCFDPRLAPMVKLWGFHDMAADPQAPPEAEDIASLLQALNAAPLYDGGAVYGPAPGVGWDFGGIGKGWIIDETLDLLAARGFFDAIVDAGGNLAVRGARGSRPWRVGIRQPDSDPAAPELLATLNARDEAVNTHGDDQRGFVYRGQRYGHLLEPSSGYPARGLRALTVVHRDGVLAEAGGAALYVAGPDGWRRLARRLGIRQVLVVREDGQIEMTAAMANRLTMARGLKARVVA